MKWNSLKESKPKLNSYIYVISRANYGDYSQDIHKVYYHNDNFGEPDFEFEDSEFAIIVHEQICYDLTHWMYCSDFPFPNQPERLSEKTSDKEDAIV